MTWFVCRVIWIDDESHSWTTQVGAYEGAHFNAVVLKYKYRSKKNKHAAWKVNPGPFIDLSSGGVIDNICNTIFTQLFVQAV